MQTNINEDFQKGLNFHQNGNLDQAEIKYKNVLSVNSNHFDSLHLLGVINSQKGDYGSAASLIKKAINFNQSNPMAYYNLAIIYKKMKKYEDAINYCNKAISLNNNYLDAINIKGQILTDIEEYEEAEIFFKKLIKLNPSFYDAYYNLGILYNKQNKIKLSINSYKKTIDLKPDFIDGYYNLGNIYLTLNENDMAEATYIEALKFDPNNSEIYNNLGQVYLNIYKLEEAEVCFERSLKFNNKNNKAYHNLLDIHFKNSNWSKTENYIKSFDNINNFKELGIPINIQAIFDRPDYEKHVNENFLNYSNKLKTNNFKNNKNKSNSKIKLAYFSADYSDNNPVAYLISDLIRFHNRNKFEVYGFSLKGLKNKDQTRKYYEKYFDNFFNIENYNEKEIANLCYSQNIDIVIDLNGYTKNSRPNIFSPKLAPVQVNFLGYPGTLGSKDYDYIIADKKVIPLKYQKYYSENIAYLPDTYFVNPSFRKKSLKKFTRKELKLPANGFVFCCLNQNYKILPNIFDVWMNILKKVESSVLLLSHTNKIAIKNLKSEAKKRGVNPNRIIFAEYLIDIADHLERYKCMDLFLDTMPYSAHTTASDVIWAGTPLITCVGKSFASRVASSILNAAGLSELITNSLKEYEEKAIEIAQDADKLKYLKIVKII